VLWRKLGYGTTGLSVGQRVFGLTDWTRNGTLAEYVAVEARNLAPLPADVEGRAIVFVVEPERSQLAELARRLRDGRLTPNVGRVQPLSEAPAALGPDAPRAPGKTIIRVAETE
jgi:NADPH:quinone reductase-like Zn-dependent oxidoreductase